MASTLYSLPRLVTLEEVQLSQAMYKLPKLHQTDASSTDVSWSSLEARQDRVLLRLRQLQSDLEALRRQSGINEDQNSVGAEVGDKIGSDVEKRRKLIEKIARLKNFVEDLLHKSCNRATQNKVGEQIHASCPTRLHLSLQVDPLFPPMGVVAFARHLEQTNLVRLEVSQHRHSSLHESVKVPELSNVRSAQNVQKNEKSEIEKSLKLAIIFKEVGRDPICYVGSGSVRGEVNCLRLLHRFYFPDKSLSLSDEQMLDAIYSDLLWNKDPKSIVDKLEKHFSAKKDNNISIVEWAALSALSTPGGTSSPAIKKWLQLLSMDDKKNKATKSRGSNEFSGENDLYSFLSSNSIAFSNVTHPPVFTVDTMKPFLLHLTGAITKNLFLKDKKDQFYLLSALHNAKIDFNALTKAVGAAQSLRFASEQSLLQKLGVVQACVTPLALINDMDVQQIQLLVDQALFDFNSLLFHPLNNAVTTEMGVEDFKRFVQLTGHTITLVDLTHFDE